MNREAPGRLLHVMTKPKLEIRQRRKWLLIAAMVFQQRIRNTPEADLIHTISLPERSDDVMLVTL